MSPTQVPSQAKAWISLSLIREAIRAIPAVRYALGAAGIAGAVALVTAIITDFNLAFFGTLTMFGFMILLVIFSSFAKSDAKDLRPLWLPIAWTFVVLSITTATLLMTSLFFKWPRPLQDYFNKRSDDPGPISKSTVSPAPASPTPSATPRVTPTPSPQQPNLNINPSSRPARARAISRYISNARSLYNQGKYEPAIRACDMALNIDPKNREAAILKGQIQRTMSILNKQ